MQPLTEQLMETSMYDAALGWMEDLTELYPFSSNINHQESYRMTRVYSVTLANTSLQIKVIKHLVQLYLFHIQLNLDTKPSFYCGILLQICFEKNNSVTKMDTIYSLSENP